jgi:nitroreductase
MDVFDAIRNRRSIRSYDEETVTEDQIETLIEAASYAPSAGNIQPWEFVVVRDPQIKTRLSVAALHQAFIEEASVVIVVCANEVRSRQGYGSRGANLYCIQDTAAATENLLLAAYALGLGTCWIGAFREDAARRALSVPSHLRPVAIIPVGIPSESPSPRRRRPLAEIIHRETF